MSLLVNHIGRHSSIFTTSFWAAVIISILPLDPGKCFSALQLTTLSLSHFPAWYYIVHRCCHWHTLATDMAPCHLCTRTQVFFPRELQNSRSWLGSARPSGAQIHIFLICFDQVAGLCNNVFDHKKTAAMGIPVFILLLITIGTLVVPKWFRPAELPSSTYPPQAHL